MEWIFILIGVIGLGGLFWALLGLTEEKPEQRVIQEEQLLRRSDLNKLEHRISDLPRQVLDSITGSTSQNKGKLAELIAYIELKAQYDRLIPLNNIVDFIGIRFPKDNDPGSFDFIDIKNGKSARLSDDQRALAKLIDTKQIQFLKLRVDTDAVDITRTDTDS